MPKYIYIEPKEGQQWVREMAKMNRPKGGASDYEVRKYHLHFLSLKSYPFEGPPGKPGEEVEGELVYQMLVFHDEWEDCDKRDWDQRSPSNRREIVRAIQPAKPDCNQHPKELFGEKDMKKVAAQIVNLNYETFAELLDFVANGLAKCAIDDAKGGRYDLATELNSASHYAHKMFEHIESAWQISKPYMKQQ